MEKRISQQEAGMTTKRGETPMFDEECKHSKFSESGEPVVCDNCRPKIDEECIYTKADMEAACELVRAAGVKAQQIRIGKLVDRFLAWPLPASVCSDACVVQRGYPHRIGTNLLTADEARQMLEYLLQQDEPDEPDEELQ